VESWDPQFGHIAEILKDGKQFWEEIPGHKSTFSFGPKKANWILHFMDTVRDFVHSRGKLPGTENDPMFVTMLGVTLTWHAHFSKVGSPVPHPYLVLANGKNSIGFGRLKAEALLQFEVKLREFAKNK
jgi:hypothetical protein